MKFTHEKPTVLGAYWWRHIEKPEVVRLIEIEADDIASLGNCINLEWSERLVEAGDDVAKIIGPPGSNFWDEVPEIDRAYLAWTKAKEGL